MQTVSLLSLRSRNVDASKSKLFVAEVSRPKPVAIVTKSSVLDIC